MSRDCPAGIWSRGADSDTVWEGAVAAGDVGMGKLTECCLSRRLPLSRLRLIDMLSVHRRENSSLSVCHKSNCVHLSVPRLTVLELRQSFERAEV